MNQRPLLWINIYPNVFTINSHPHAPPFLINIGLRGIIGKIADWFTFSRMNQRSLELRQDGLKNFCES
ncbi:hypothetical protein ES704_01833 [subsurface metagenome]